MSSYKEPVKRDVRERLLKNAVTALTGERSESPLVRIEELEAVTSYATTNLAPPHVSANFRDNLQAELSAWKPFYQSSIGNREPGELKVLYLCGPEPLNDLEVLMSLGVDIHNVWAVTSTEKDLASAVQQVEEARLALKIHHGNVAGSRTTSIMI